MKNNNKILFIGGLILVSCVLAYGQYGNTCVSRNNTACTDSYQNGGCSCSQIQYSNCQDCVPALTGSCTPPSQCTATPYTGSGTRTPNGCDCSCTTAGTPYQTTSGCS